MSVDPRIDHLLLLSRNLNYYEGPLVRQGGEHFNLFKILKIERMEVKTHSPVLAELLDPQGSHGQGAVFLKLFVSRFGLPSFCLENAQVELEIGTGRVTQEEGGRLDILVTDGVAAQFLIENKIDAVEQRNQLSRYEKFAPAAALFYLTLDGCDPVNLKGAKPANLKCISYARDVLGWLDDCRKEATGAPLVRESIAQYIHIVKELTHQTTGSRMNKEIVKAVLESRENLQAYNSLCDAQREIRTTIIAQLQQTIATIATDADMDYEGSSSNDLSAKYAGFSFSCRSWSPHLRIRFEFDRSDYREFFFGFIDNGKLPAEQRALLREIFSRVYRKPESSDVWAAWVYWDRYREWGGDTFEEIHFGQFATYFRVELAKLATIAEKFSQTCAQGASASPSGNPIQS